MSGNTHPLRVIVTGSGGYIGIPLCEALALRGHSVVAVDRWFFGRKPKGVIACVQADIRDFTDFTADVLIDLAGLSNDASAELDIDLTRRINRDGGIALARAAKKNHVNRYIYSSSASVYGNAGDLKMTETAAVDPLTVYSECKLAVEAEINALQSGSFDTVILRNATVFGASPRMRFDLAINGMTLSAWRGDAVTVHGDGTQWRPFIHVSDLSRAFVLMAECPVKAVSGETFNVGGDALNTRVADIATAVIARFPSAPTRFGVAGSDLRSYRMSFEKIRSRFTFEPRVTIGDGVEEVAMALELSKLNGADPTTRTVGWYSSMLEWDRRLTGLRLGGRLL